MLVRLIQLLLRTAVIFGLCDGISSPDDCGEGWTDGVCSTGTSLGADGGGLSLVDDPGDSESPKADSAWPSSSSSPSCSRWPRRRIGSGGGEMTEGRHDEHATWFWDTGRDLLLSNLTILGVWSPASGVVKSCKLKLAGCTMIIPDMYRGLVELETACAGILDTGSFEARLIATALARFCCSRNHLSISFTRKSFEAIQVWNGNSESEGGIVSLANFWHLRTMRSLRRRISIIRGQLTDFFVISYLSSLSSCSYMAAVPGGIRTYVISITRLWCHQEMRRGKPWGYRWSECTSSPWGIWGRKAQAGRELGSAAGTRGV